uniref:preprotein translocase subunit SecA n=1 Tax=Glaucosphaera vacuolata TaxID=38265 RepID=UPI001FCCFC49|nr:preprotein translocase subunit SecA [Glaucosphaera vacuolata]UNJ18643.1 preprotein translocase subunit SecA [Glaucosphaera vacuolata]
MFTFLSQKFSEQKLRKYRALIQKINSLEKEISCLTNKQIQQKTQYLKEAIRKGASLDSILPEAFALVREAGHRVLKIRLFDVQLLGGIVLHEAKIAEMKTGEGKTLVASLPAYLNALSGKGVHIVTVNDYLAKRDSIWIGKIHKFLGLSVGLIQQGMSREERKVNYNCDITYVTNSELGFDYLRDNMVIKLNDITQRPFYYCIIDEVDSILIDEARTPLIISEQTQVSIKKYQIAQELSLILQRNKDYEVDEKKRSITLTEEGLINCEAFLGVKDLYDIQNPWASYIDNALKAKELFIKDTHYIVKNNQILIVDEFTGRIMPERQWSDGLHQSIEAKEKTEIHSESQALASITYQNFFLLYPRLAGMTGTAKTDATELEKIYNLETISIPTHKPMIREDLPDIIFKTEYAKWKAVIAECVKIYNTGRPILVGTTSVEKSELLSSLLGAEKIPHNLLNAKPENVAREAEIVAQAGRKYSITIATNMAGRGTDILLGGNADYIAQSQVFDLIKLCYGKLYNLSQVTLILQKLLGEIGEEEIYPILNSLMKILYELNSHTLHKEVTFYNLVNNVIQEKNFNTSLEKNIFSLYETLHKKATSIVNQEREEVKTLGGLYIIGTERHESRRIDNQLRGRAGRQGDPGSSRFFLSLEDNLLRIFAQDKITKLSNMLNLGEDMYLESTFLTKTLDSAQQKIEAYFFEMRKQIFDYDEVLNNQRKVVYKERRFVLETDYLRDLIIQYAEITLDEILNFYFNDTPSLKNNSILEIQELLGIVNIFDENELKKSNKMELRSLLYQQIYNTYDLKESYLEKIRPGLIRQLEQYYLLEKIDNSWKSHLKQIEVLRESVGWRSYGQKDPLIEYKNDAFILFVAMHRDIRDKVVFSLLRTNIIMNLPIG